MEDDVTMRLILDGEEMLLIEGKKQGKNVNWERMKEGSRFFPPFLMRNQTVEKTFKALKKYVDNLRSKGIFSEQGYTQGYTIAVSA